jgi:hypothetical protein
MSNLSTGTKQIAVTASDTAYITGPAWVIENNAQQTATSATVASDLVTLASSGLVDGDLIMITNAGTVTGISAGSLYYIVGTSGSTFKFALTWGGSAIDLGGANTTPPSWIKTQDYQVVRQEGFLSVTTSGTYRVLPATHEDTNTTTVAANGAQDIYIVAGVPYPLLVKKVFSTGSASTSGLTIVTN